ncbi:LUD domain-containing protein [Haladaptatus sp. DFWS20]|uniref:LUD domain-containing protein n=1 Tax=Haladaptatus sp. DFWS20 TaxID=3403467 RepID=UPI003EC1021D
MSSDRRRKAAHIRHLLETEGDSVNHQTVNLNTNRIDTVSQFDEFESLREQARAIKEETIETLPERIDEVRDAVEANGGSVYLASDADDANRYIERVLGEKDAESVVKSKSMTTEEIELNDHLEANSIDVWETDLGEFVLQVADETPSHIVGPAMHKSRDEIADLFNLRFDPKEPLKTADELTRFAREYLGERICEADAGITGANFVLAESGSIVLVTNEGNARKSAVTPDTHIAVAGVEKLIPSIDTLQPFVELIARSATGQPISQYVTMLTPPVASPTLDFESDDPLVDAGNEDRAFHLVLLDNGRMTMREDSQLQETLYCIRCGACANSCANFQHVGGHGFGGETYSGGIATGWEAGVQGQESAAEFNDLCTGCSRCITACPVKIDIPWINTVVRDRINRDGETPVDPLIDAFVPDGEPAGLDLQKRLFGNFGTLAKLGSKTAPISNWLSDTTAGRMVLERAFGIDRRRALPEFRRETLVEWFENREITRADIECAGSSRPDTTLNRRVVLYPDAYTNYIQPERGKAAVRVLESLGVGVTVPRLPASGRAPLSQGMISAAEKKACAVHDELRLYLNAGFDIVVVEPSDVAMFREEYGKFLDEPAANTISEASYEILEYVYGLLANGADVASLRAPGDNGDERLAYHSHCQQRTQGLAEYTLAVLDELGYDVVTSSVECCGMAGSFGYKDAYYELSMDIGESLRDDLGVDESAREVIASGTSCVEQLKSLIQRKPRHPVELIDPTVSS